MKLQEVPRKNRNGSMNSASKFYKRDNEEDNRTVNMLIMASQL